MKAITIILVTLFLIVSCFFGFLLIKKVLNEAQTASEPETQQDIAVIEDKASPEEQPAPDKEEQEETEDFENISKIEIYLDGDRENGIFLGEAEYGLPSEELSLMYGKNFLYSGFSLLSESTDYTFEPGSIHCLYIYTLIPEYGWDCDRKEIQIAGELETAENIRLYVDNPKHNVAVTGEIRISGWAADLNPPDNPNISKIEIYLDGPKGFGKAIGEAKYGLERPDVAKALNNENYTKSGYSLTYDTSSLEPGFMHSFYVYAHSPAGQYQLVKRDITVEGERKESNTIASMEANFGSGQIEIKGWAVSRSKLKSGISIPLDTEYAVKKIVFVSNKNGNEDIFSMNLDGSELTQLTDYPGNDMYPSVSPDGKKIAYTSDIGGSWQILIMNWDGTGKTQITANPERNGYPAWSFDSNYIFFEMYIDGDWELYRVNSDGSSMKRLTFNPGADDWHPRGHPFEYKVLYESGTVGHEDIYIMDYNGENIKKISDFNLRKRVPSMSRDTKLIAFMGYEGNNHNIFTMDDNGENIQKLTDNPENCGHPDISPDNVFITYEGKVNGQNEIFIMNIDGSDQKQLTNIPGHDWDPVFIYQISP